MFLFKNLINFLSDKSFYIYNNKPEKLFTNFIGIASINNASRNHITFFNDYKLTDELIKTKAKACFIKKNDISNLPITCIPIIVDNPYLAYAYTTNFLCPKIVYKNEIKKSVKIDKSSTIGNNIQIDDFVVIKENTIINDNVIIYSNSVIGPNVIIGSNSTVKSNCIISDSIIGNNCLIQSGCIIGDIGFGFIPDKKIEIKHIGNVVIKDNVQIGSNTTIDKAALDSTIIHENVRIDNLVQIAHNVIIGSHTIIAAQTGIAGSTKIGKNCLIGGQVGITGHIKIGDDVVIAAKSGVTKSLKNKSTVAGFPAVDINIWRKNFIKQYRKK